MADYGYFGSGTEGYAHYKQTFDSTFPSSGSRGSYHSTVHSSPSTRADMAEKMDAEPQNSADQDNVVINLLFSLGMLGLALVVGAMIYIVLS